ncbi:lipopolysaccharide kinase InaA family protein [Planctomicrobium sp. SH661]|uniref:lipopolysaccharide kinase InaA family protein n=1 Tax=Planctomicrobium sp. SH661 TaxID=3448124 RepID=UPI003F5C587F
MKFWPDDYVTLDSGNLSVHPDDLPWCREQNWTTAAALLQATFSGELLRRRDDADGWDNVRWSFSTGTQTATCFVKRHRIVGESLSPSLQEARAVGWCERAGAPCMRIVAVGEIPGGLRDEAGRVFTSFFISAAVGTGVTAYQRLGSMIQSEASPDEIRQLISAIALTAGRFHAADLYHGDCHFPHFLVDESGPELAARVIDLQGMRQATGLEAYYLWLKDMGQLRHSLIRLGLYRRYANHWYSAYREAADSPQIHKWLDQGGRRRISLRGDLRLFRRIVASAAKLDFARARMLINDRMRAA